MKIAVIGLWHLGTVTAACLANKDFHVIAYDDGFETITQLQNLRAPVFEPGLDLLIENAVTKKSLTFSLDKKDIQDADLIWITYDTPVDDDDKADVDLVINKVKELFPYIKNKAVVLISSQLPIGSTARLQNAYNNEFPQKDVCFAYSPENLRLGKAIEVFTKPDRIIIGLNDKSKKLILENVLQVFTDNLIWMSVESAEMTKHAINAFLATSVVFANELATLCEKVGAEASEVEKGLKSEERIGPKAYLRAGNAFAGGTLARDINYLIDIAEIHETKSNLFPAVLISNLAHRKWAQNKLKELISDLGNTTIAILGLTYKPGTDTLRRSTAVEICQWLHKQGTKVIAFDPAIKSLPAQFDKVITLATSIEHALQNAKAALILTEWPEFKEITAEKIKTHMKQPLVLDSGSFLSKNLANTTDIQYVTVGKKV